MGYKFQFITLAGFHSLNYSMFNLAHGYAREQHDARSSSCRRPSSRRPTRASPRSSISAKSAPSYFDAVTTTVQGSQSSTTALTHSTEDEQFFDKPKAELSVA